MEQSPRLRHAGYRYKCLNHVPKRRFGSYLNTFVEGARINHNIPEHRIILLIFSWLKKDPVSKVIKDYNFSSETAVYWYGICREVATSIAWHDIVEVDASPIFKQHFWVVSGISCTTKTIFAIIVQRCDQATLLEHVDVDSFICTDGWKGFSECDSLFSGHGQLNHSQSFLSSPKDAPPFWIPTGRFHANCLDKQWKGQQKCGMVHYRHHTQNIGKCWRDMKEQLRSTQIVATAENHLGEYMYRRNVLNEFEGLNYKFSRFLRDIARAYPGIGKKLMKLSRAEILKGCDCHECVLD